MERVVRHMWGILFCANFRGDPPGLIYRSWLRPEFFNTYPGEPSRLLVFATREAARRYCKAQHTKHKTSCPDWRFKPVRIKETMEMIGE